MNSKTKNQLVREGKKEAPAVPAKDILYPFIPSRKDKDMYFGHFLDIFRKLNITIPFGEALQQMSMYAKFVKDLLSKKGKYIDNESIKVKGNCSAVI